MCYDEMECLHEMKRFDEIQQNDETKMKMICFILAARK